MPTVIYWQKSEAVPEQDDLTLNFLAPVELERLSSMRVPKRRREWLLGRLTAKRLLLSSDPDFSGCNPSDLTILNRPEGEPYLLVKGSEVPGCLSITHSSGGAVAAWTREKGVRIGVDLERVEPRLPVFVEDYFTPGEIQVVNQTAPEYYDRTVTLIWSAKEAMLKALGKGLRIDTRSVEILRVANDKKDWNRLQVRCNLDETQSWLAFYQFIGQDVLTFAVLGEAGEVVLREEGERGDEAMNATRQ